jgi:hypothetical protein
MLLEQWLAQLLTLSRYLSSLHGFFKELKCMEGVGPIFAHSSCCFRNLFGNISLSQDKMIYEQKSVESQPKNRKESKGTETFSVFNVINSMSLVYTQNFIKLLT